jgi:hypothetical protein
VNALARLLGRRRDALVNQLEDGVAHDDVLVARSVEDNGAGDQLVWSLIPDRRGELEPADLPAA